MSAVSKHRDRARAAGRTICRDCGGTGLGSVCATCEGSGLAPRSPIAPPPARLLLCLGPCHGEFYLPLGDNDRIVCPTDPTHPVAIYQAPTIHKGEE